MENDLPVEEVEVKENVTKIKKTKHSFWDKFFSDNYVVEDELRVLLVEHFLSKHGEDFVLDAQMDYEFQREVIKICIDYSKSKSSNWVEKYGEVIRTFSNKSIMTILKEEN